MNSANQCAFNRWNEFCWDVSMEKAGWLISRKANLYYTDMDACSSGREPIPTDLLKLIEYQPESFRRRVRRYGVNILYKYQLAYHF